LGGLPSTAAVAKALPGAKLVKAFNHLPARTLAQGPKTPQGGRRIVFISSDDDAASASVATLVDRLGFAPIELGKIGEGGLLVQARGRAWGPSFSRTWPSSLIEVGGGPRSRRYLPST
jgi:8-hydroxy-5-deazaflavin:NADPH oxidoreductase